MTLKSLVAESEPEPDDSNHLSLSTVSLSNKDPASGSAEEKMLQEPLVPPVLDESDPMQIEEEMTMPTVGRAVRTRSVQTNLLTSFGKRLEFVSVTAPMTMRSGATFVARLEDDEERIFQVTVPDGGVLEGEEFTVFYPREFLNPSVIPPYGRWKDRIFDCFSLAVCHQTVWFTFLFPLIAIAHLFRRLKLTCCATQSTMRGAKATTRFMIFFTIAIIIWFTTALLYGLHFKLYKKTWYQAVFLIPVVLLIFYMMFLTSRARYIVRQRYNIPPKFCGKKLASKPCTGVMEDILYGICCTHCSICQLSRQTCDYKSYPAKIFRPDGLPRGTPIV